MADMDLDDILDAPTQGPSRPARFAPKGSKFKPRPKTEQSQSEQPSSSGSVEPLPVPKKEDPDIKPHIKNEYANDAVEMDVDVKPAVKEEGADLMDTGAMEAEAEPVDEVVREIDVYFSPSFDPKTLLYVLQYPLRPLWRPYELEERCEEVRVMPGSSEVEVDLAVDVDSKNYDSGANLRVQMKKQTLAASWKPPQVSGCAVGVLTGNKLHLNPIHAVVQLRPSMQRLDSLDSRESKRKTVGPSKVEDAVKSEDPQEGTSSGASRKLGWVPLKYHSARSDLAAEYLKKIMERGGSQICFSMNPYDYLNSLCPGTSSDSFSSKGPPRRILLTLPLKERFKTWFLEGPPIHRFDALKHLAPDESVEEVLGVLQELARLVQGLWVPRSTLVYGKDAGIEVFARDYVLLLFTKNVIINDSKLPHRPTLAKAMRDVLHVLAVERPAFNDWKLRESPDLRFIKLNPSVVKKQEEEWQCLESKINDSLGGRSGPAMKTSLKSNTSNNPPTLKASNRVATRTPNGVTSRTAMSADVREAITKALQKLFKSVKVCSFQQICQRLRDMAVSESARSTGFAKEAVTAANSIDAFPDELQAIISQVAVNIHGIYVPKSSPDHPQYDAFRKVVIDLFLAEGPNAKIKKAPILEAAKMELKREVPLIEFNKVLHELCISQSSAWVLRSADGNPQR